MPSKFAIVWNARYDPTYDMEREEGLIEENMNFYKEMGGLFWDHRWKRGFPYDGPFTGYIRDCMKERGKRWLTHRATVEKVYRIAPSNSDPIPMHEKNYIPKFREQCYTGKEKSGISHEKSQIWFKLVNLRPLSRPRSVMSLTRFNDRTKPYKREFFLKYIKIVDRDYR